MTTNPNHSGKDTKSIALSVQGGPPDAAPPQAAQPAPAKESADVAEQVTPLCWVGVNKQGDVTHHSNSKTSYAPIPVVMKRQFDIAMRNWDMWKQQAMDLNERLQKYEPGSPMHINRAEKP